MNEIRQAKTYLVRTIKLCSCEFNCECEEDVIKEVFYGKEKAEKYIEGHIGYYIEEVS